MEIAVTLNAHGNTELVLDTIDSIKTYVSNDILVVVDGSYWDSWGEITKLPVYKLKGFEHNFLKSPYKNLTLGLNKTLDTFGDHYDWYCYTEHDVLFTSDTVHAPINQIIKMEVTIFIIKLN